MLTIQDITYRVGGRTLLDNVNVNIPSGHRIGLIGPNGAGKTTLFKLISGELTPDGGSISRIKNSTIGLVRQDFPDIYMPIIDVVLAADTERTALLHEAETCEDMNRIGDIYDRLNDIGAYDAPSRASTILAGLGFDEAAQARPVADYSGGWRARVALAAVLFQQPNILLLDEPTNHLDFESLVWLESFLQRYRETLVIISHDRDFLNKTVNHILHLEKQKLISYTGTYDQFERTRAERLMGQQALYEKQQAQKAHMMKFVDRFRAKASKARQAQSRLKAIEKMDVVDAVIADRVTAFTFPDPGDMKSPMLQLNAVDAGYEPGKPILRNLNLNIDSGDRIALLGANGNGKSTLVKIIADRLPPMAGELVKSGKLKIGYFAQFQTDELDVTQTPLETMQQAMKEPLEVKVRSALFKFGFDKHKADTKVGELSGGEKARLLFCLMSHHAPHIMLLDEPTNHLDMDAREALIQALNNYNGAIILVSHDPHLVECVADQLWVVADGKCRPFDGDLDEYRQFIIRQRREEKSPGKKDAPKDSKAKSGKKSSTNKIEQLEQKLAALTAQKDALENELAAACSDGTAPGSLMQLQASYDKLLADIQRHEHDLLMALDAA